MLSRAARRAGQSAATTPTSPAETKSSARRPHGSTSVQVSRPMVATSSPTAQPKKTPRPDAEHAAEERDDHRLQPDHPLDTRPVQADGPEQADLLGAFVDGHRHRVDHAEDGDDDGEREHPVEDVQDEADRAGDVRRRASSLPLIWIAGLSPSACRRARSDASLAPPSVFTKISESAMRSRCGSITDDVGLHAVVEVAVVEAGELQTVAYAVGPGDLDVCRPAASPWRRRSPRRRWPSCPG